MINNTDMITIPSTCYIYIMLATCFTEFGCDNILISGGKASQCCHATTKRGRRYMEAKFIQRV